MNILLIAINAKYIHSNPAVYSLKACTGAYRSYVDIVEFTINQQPSYILQEIYKRQPDVAAFSCYIWNRNMLDVIIPDLHKILPYTDFWAGGPEVSYNPEEIISRWQLRGVMTGPGERTFAHLVSSYIKGNDCRLPAILTGSYPDRISLDEIPFWYAESKEENASYDTTDFKNRIIYYESSRGCPFSCSYCLSSIDKIMDFRSVSRVLRELSFFLDRKVPQVKFVDRTFNCKKDHALPILQHILEHDNGITNFHFEIAADLLDEDYFALLRQMRPGAVQLEIGVQSTNPETIAAIERRMDFAKTAAIVRQIISWNNIHIHLDLIAGLPFEDMDSFRNSFNEVYALRPEQLQLGFLKVLRGSAIEQRAPQYDLLYNSLPPYEVLSTKWLSYEDICCLKQVEEVLEIYYNSGQFTHTLDFLCSYFNTPFSMYESLAYWYEEHGQFGVQSSRIRKYEILLDFGIHNISNTTMENTQRISLLREYVTYDLYLREHMKNRPGFTAPIDKWKDTIHSILHHEAETHNLIPELKRCNYRELTKILHVEVFESIFEKPCAVLFCYERSDPLTNNCLPVKISVEDPAAVNGTLNM